MEVTKKMKNGAQNLLLTACTVALFFGVGEIALRITGIDSGRPQTPPIYDVSPYPNVSYQLKPNLTEKAFRSTVVTNSIGLRSPEPDNAKQTLTVIGDSIAFGYGVENGEMLGSRISSELNDQYNVMTFAAPGYTLKQETEFYKNKIGSMESTAVILVFYWNDLTESEPPVLSEDGNLHQPGWVKPERECNPIEEGVMGMVPGRCWLDLHSAFYRTMKKIIVRNTEHRNMEAQIEENKQNPVDSISNEQVRRYARELNAFIRILPKNSPRLFVIWPDREFHHESLPLLAAAAEKAGFRVVNLYETFGNEMETLSWDTVHPSAKSLAKAAEIIAERLREEKFVP